MQPEEDVHRVTFARSIRLFGRELRSNCPYLIERAGLPKNSDPADEAVPWPNSRQFDASQDWNGKRLLLIRNGGFGDLLLLTPTLAALRRRWPRAQIVVCAGIEYGQVLEGNPDIDARVLYPIDAAEAEGYDALIEFEETTGYERRERSTHSVDLFAQIVGVTIDDKRLRYKVACSRLEWARKAYPKSNRIPRVGIQVAASNQVRSYPGELVLTLARELAADGCELFFFGTPGQFPVGIELYGKIFEGESISSFTENVSLLLTCDVCIAPDSSFCHVGGALGIPTVALYGPFPSALRTTYYRSVLALDGRADCAPCFYHTRGTDAFPSWGPCSVTRRCEALSQISPLLVAAEVKKMLSCIAR